MANSSNNGPPVVVDFGSDSIKAGFAGENHPKVFFPTVIGRDKNSKELFPESEDDHAHLKVGNAALAERELLALSNPLDTILDPGGLLTIWDFIFKGDDYCKGLNADPTNHPLLATTQARRAGEQCDVAFELFRVPKYYATDPTILACLASGKTSGLVADIGKNTSKIVPVHDSYIIEDAVTSLGISGQDLEKHMRHLLIEKDENFTRNVLDGRRFAKEICEKHCYVAMDLNMEAAKKRTGIEYDLPDGNRVALADELFQVPEMIFTGKGDNKSEGIAPKLDSTIRGLKDEYQQIFYGNVVLAGGITMYPGFVPRLEKDLRSACPPEMQLNIAGEEDKRISAWIGGSILASLPTFHSMWITRDEYAEHGNNIFSRKCKYSKPSDEMVK